jgi:hypothetical protein
MPVLAPLIARVGNILPLAVFKLANAATLAATGSTLYKVPLPVVSTKIWSGTERPVLAPAISAAGGTLPSAVAAFA